MSNEHVFDILHCETNEANIRMILYEHFSDVVIRKLRINNTTHSISVDIPHITIEQWYHFIIRQGWQNASYQIGLLRTNNPKRYMSVVRQVSQALAQKTRQSDLYVPPIEGYSFVVIGDNLAIDAQKNITVDLAQAVIYDKNNENNYYLAYDNDHIMVWRSSSHWYTDQMWCWDIFVQARIVHSSEPSSK